MNVDNGFARAGALREPLGSGSLLTAEDVYNQTKANDEAMTPEEKQDEKLRFCRGLRNQKLEKTDVYMPQIDRYSQKQIDQLKAYRQSLRDLPSLYNINNLKEIVEYPPAPDFIQLASPMALPKI